MTRLFAVLPAWWFLQSSANQITPHSINVFAEYGIGVGMVLLLAALWREDRKSRIEFQSDADKRYGMLVDQMKNIVQDNTKAMVTLADGMKGKITNCPFGNDPLLGTWLKAWMHNSVEEHHKHRETTD
jgi:hypothetical protein